MRLKQNQSHQQAKKYKNNIICSILNYQLDPHRKSNEIEGFLYSNHEKERKTIHDSHDFPMKTPCFMSKRSKNEYYHEGVNSFKSVNSVRSVEERIVSVKPRRIKKKRRSRFDFKKEIEKIKKIIEKRKENLNEVRRRRLNKYIISVRKEFYMKRVGSLCKNEMSLRESHKESHEESQVYSCNPNDNDVFTYKKEENTLKDDEKKEKPTKNKKIKLKKRNTCQLNVYNNKNKEKVFVKDNFLSKAIENIKKNERKAKEKEEKTLLNNIFSQYYINLSIENVTSISNHQVKQERNNKNHKEINFPIRKHHEFIQSSKNTIKNIKSSMPGYESSIKTWNKTTKDMFSFIFNSFDLNLKEKISFLSLSSSKISNFLEEYKDFTFILPYLNHVKTMRREVSKDEFLSETMKIFQKMSVFDKGKIIKNWKILFNKKH